MRVVLGCSMGGAGHLMPVLAAARAVASLGHEPVVLVPPSLADGAREAELEVAVGDQPPQAELDAIWDRVRAGPPATVAGLIDRELFAQRAADAMAEAATTLCARVAPGLVLRESCEYATAFVAHRSGIPQAQLGISRSRLEHGVLRHVADVLERRSPGVVQAIADAPYLTPFPGSLDPSPWADTRRYRPASGDVAALPNWWAGDERPLVYVTFGSVLGGLPEAGGAFAAALRAVDGLPVRVLLTVGRAVDPRTLGRLPANVHVERWVDQDAALAAAELVVCHGGSGTVFGALGAGRPLVVCPLFADQTTNARLVGDAGAGVVVAPGRPAGGVAALGPGDVPRLRGAITDVLGSAAHREAAGAIARELAAAPELETALVGLVSPAARRATASARTSETPESARTSRGRGRGSPTSPS